MEFLTNVIPLFPGGTTPRECGGPTFGELACRWLAVEGKKRVCPENNARHIRHLSQLLHLTEAGLRPRIVKEVLAGLSQALGPSTVNKVRSTGKLIIDEAILNEEWRGPNPFAAVKRAKEIKKVQLKVSLEEVRAILPHLSHYRRREALFMLYLGTRPGEMRGVRKVDVDLGRGLITIRRSNGRDSTKTGKERLVPIPEGLWPWLEDAVRSSRCENVFPERGGERAQRHDAKLTRVLREPLRQAGLVTGYILSCRRKGCGHKEERIMAASPPCPKCGFKLLPVGIPMKFRFYDLRHSAATLHRRAGADPLAIQIALGHAPENLTDSVYTHLTIDDVRRELNKLEI